MLTYNSPWEDGTSIGRQGEKEPCGLDSISLESSFCLTELGANWASLVFINLFLAVLGLRGGAGRSPVAAYGAFARRCKRAFTSRGTGCPSLLCFGSSSPWLLLLQSVGSRRTGVSCITSAWLPSGLWDLPGPGIEPIGPASAALTGRFSTSGPPGGPTSCFCYFVPTKC